MILKDLLKDDVNTGFFDDTEFAENATYNGITILVIAAIGGQMPKNPNTTEHSYEEAVFTVKKADVPKPQSGDTLIYNGKTYLYAAIEAEPEGMFRLRFIANNSGVSGKGVHLL